MLQRMLCLSFIIFCNQVAADSATDKLLDYFAGTKTMRAQFVQTIKGDRSSNTDENRGVLTMQRPGKFIWDYQFPYEQQIIADGKQLWIYDVDLDQAIVKPLDSVLGDTPAVLLSGSATVTERFNIKEIPAPEADTGLIWLHLTPIENDVGYEQLLLAFKGSDLKEMQLTDAFGQTTRLVFSKIEKNPTIDPQLFSFIPPEGVDVIRGDSN